MRLIWSQTVRSMTQAAGAKNPMSWEHLRPRVTRRLLAEIAHRIEARFHPDKIILFGSYAYGKPDIHSDVDLFVIMRSRQSMHDRIVRVSEIAEVPFLPMDVLVYTPREVRDRLRLGDPFIAEIFAKGRILYPSGPPRRVDRKGRS